MHITRIEPEPSWLGGFVMLGPAEFAMGAAMEDRFAASSEKPVRAVSITRRFAIGVFPVTTGQWNFGKPDGLPVVGVSWNRITEWLAIAREKSGLPLRLPSEAEWEFAARAGSLDGFPEGETLSPTEANFLHDDAKQRVGPGCLTPRHTYPPNRFGIEDMLGNVAEWTADSWWSDLTRVPDDGGRHQDTNSPLKVVRSAGWDAMPRLLRLSARHPRPDDCCQDDLGFRLAFHPS